MREIKFKVFYNGKLFGYERLTPEGWECYSIDGDTNGIGEILRWNKLTFTHKAHSQNPYYFERKQFIGLSDKNGMEIYEGDIVETFTFGMKVIGYVKYVRDAFVIYGKYDNKENKKHTGKNSTLQNFPCYGICYNITIIGNILENKELLKKE